jgi:replicative DNA helicase
VIDRLPPQSLDSEQAVLGSILIDRDAIIEVADFLTAEAFYRQSHGRIYAAMLGLYERHEPIDVVTVAEVLERTDELESVGGAGYLSTLGNDTPTAVHVAQYGRIVADKAVLRKLIGAAGRIAGIGYEDGGDIQEAIDRAQAVLFEACAQRARKGFIHVKPLLHQTYDYLEEIRGHRGQVIGVASGLHDLDELTLGFQASDLVVIAARPGTGKTAIALQIAAHAARHERTVGFFSLEMSNKQLAMRLVSGAAYVDGENLRSGYATPEEFSRVLDAMQVLSETEVYFDDTPSLSTLELRTRARRLQMEHGLDLIVVDYLQLMQAVHRSKDGNRVQEVTEIAEGLKGLAKELDVPVVALSQLNRRSENTDSGEPRMSDLRESGAIEQAADLILLMWRDREQPEQLTDGEIINAHLTKQRNGPTGYMKFLFRKAQTRFESVVNTRE